MLEFKLLSAFKMSSKKISVILPAYNEKESLLKLIPAIHQVLLEYE